MQVTAVMPAVVSATIFARRRLIRWRLDLLGPPSDKDNHMAAAFIAGFLLATIIVVWAIIATVRAPANKQVRFIYFSCFAAAAMAAYFTTYQYIYYPNENTRFHGWPVPWVVEQRENLTAPWLDFIGPLIVLAYPMNLILYILLPSVVALAIVYRLPARAQSRRV